MAPASGGSRCAEQAVSRLVCNRAQLPQQTEPVVLEGTSKPYSAAAALRRRYFLDHVGACGHCTAVD